MYRRAIGALAALMLALVSAVALASPAQAGGNKPVVSFDDTCADITITVDNATKREVLVRMSSDSLAPEPFWVPKRSEHAVEWPAEDGEGVVVEYKSFRGWKLIGDHSWSSPGWPSEGCASPSVLIVEDCAGSAVVTIAAGDTARLWKVGDAERFLDFGEVAEFEALSLDIDVLWLHDDVWQAADKDYVSRFPAEDCEEPSPEPTVSPTPEPSTSPTPEPTGSPTASPESSANSEAVLASNDGPQLPKTGSPVLILIAAGLGLLAVGGATTWLTHRRRSNVAAQ